MEHPVSSLDPSNDHTSSEGDYEALPSSTPLGISMAAGAVAGMMEHSVMYPVDAIKTRMQVATTSGNMYRGVIQSISSVWAAEGGMALWRGIGSLILGAGPAHAIHFAVYEAVTNTLNPQGHTNSHPLTSAIAGSSATIASDALMNPFDVIKQRMQLQRARFSATASQIFRNEGIRAFYVSYPTTLLMNVPFSAVNFTVYDTLSHILNPRRKHDPLIHCVSGGVAGAVAAALSTPFDVIKTLLQTRGVSQIEEARRLRGFADAARYIYQVDGVFGFVKGVRPRILANMPSTAICWTVYEMAKHYIMKM